MAALGTNYRKGRREETLCPQCVFYWIPFAPDIRGRCAISNIGPSMAVGKKMTCDDVVKKKGINDIKRNLEAKRTGSR